jgi:hypothetical protein
MKNDPLKDYGKTKNFMEFLNDFTTDLMCNYMIHVKEILVDKDNFIKIIRQFCPIERSKDKDGNIVVKDPIKTILIKKLQQCILS